MMGNSLPGSLAPYVKGNITSVIQPLLKCAIASIPEKLSIVFHLVRHSQAVKVDHEDIIPFREQPILMTWLPAISLIVMMVFPISCISHRLFSEDSPGQKPGGFYGLPSMLYHPAATKGVSALQCLSYIWN